jgi:hypothetical protein
MATRWHFVESDAGDSPQWAWRIVRADGTIDSQSHPFKTYGMAVIDAIKKGFQPRREPWIVATRHTITHYHPGRPPMTVPVTDEASTPAALKSKLEKGTSLPRDSDSEPLEPRGRQE